MAATASEDFTCRIWDLDEEACAHVLEGHSGWCVLEFVIFPSVLFTVGVGLERARLGGTQQLVRSWICEFVFLLWEKDWSVRLVRA